ncbi:MAG: putative CRISPR-associated protein [Nitrospira sp.]|nr:putative CRISPR-associated protein [Nitrospira sp.]
MQRTILTTVGTSLLTNRDRPWAGWRDKQPLPNSQVVDKWLSEVRIKDDKNDPLSVVAASAETHTWYRLALFDAEDKDKIEVVLIHSQTSEGQFCADRLVAFASAKGMKARRKQVDGLDYTDGQKFNRGLRQLARVIGEEIKRGRAAGTVELAATGGFKAEIAIANLVGAISETPVHYIYQEFSSIVTIEPIPVALRGEWIRAGAGGKLLEEFKTADAIIPSKRIESLLKQDERLLTLVEVDGDHAALTLLGELALRLFESPGENWPPTTDIPPDEKIQLSSVAHGRPRDWEQIVKTIASSRYVTSIRYEGSVAGGCLKEAPDNYSDLIHRIEGSPPLTLRITTTATTSEQRRLVQQLLSKELKLHRGGR